MQLYCDTYGRGREIVLLHGWGFHGGIWDVLTQRLADRRRVLVPDLPGHGYSKWSDAIDAMDTTNWRESVVDEISRRLAGPAVWIGWSLGGLLALTAALRYPQAIERLILIGTTPKFTQDDSWSCAVSPRLLDRFETDLVKDPARGLRRFLALMFGSSASERAALRDTRRQTLERGTPCVAALRVAVDVLRYTDLRPELPSLRVPVLIVQGGQDRIVPTDAARYLARSLPDARLELIEPAGHAPFITHPDTVVRTLRAFLHA